MLGTLAHRHRFRTTLGWIVGVILFGLTLASSNAFALNSGITYHGRILQPDGVTPVAGVVQFKMQIRTPDASNCLMYEEWQSIDLTGTNGVFAITINDGSGTRHDSSGLTIDTLFANRVPFTFSPSTCTGSSTYTPAISDGRNLVVTFQSSTMTAEEQMPIQSLNFAPLAIEAKQVSGFQAANLLRFAKSDGTLVNTSPLNDVEYAALVALVDGTSTVYAKPGDATNGTPIYTTSTGTIASTTVGDMWLDTSTPGSDVLKINTDSGIKTIGLSSTGFITQVTAGTGIAVSTASGNATVGIAAGGVGTTQLAAAAVTGAKIASGTITGTNLDAGIVIATTGTVSAASMGTRALGISNSQATPDTVSLLAPAASFTNYSLILPTSAGSSGQVLATDGSGNLSWISPSTGSVTSVSAATTPGNPIVVIGGSTPTIDIGKADLTHNGYLASSDFSSFNSKASGSLASGNVYVGNASGVAVGVPFTGDVSLSNAGLTKVIGLQGVGIGTSAPTAAGQVLRYDGTSQYQSTFLSMADIRSTVAPGTTIFPATNCAASKALSWSSLTDAFTCQDIAISAAQVSGLGSAAYLNVGVGSNSVVQLDGSSRLPAVDGSQLTNLNASALASGTISPSLLPASASTWGVNGTSIYNTNTGNVGIGTDTPAVPLDIESNTYAALLAFNYNTSQEPQILMRRSRGTQAAPSASLAGDLFGSIVFGGETTTLNTTGATITAGAEEDWTGTGRGTYLGFSTKAAGTNTLSPKMRITSAGNVGIGTTAPGYKLDVAGQVNATAFSIGGVPISAGGASAWAVNGTTIYNTNSGNVGIGTDVPSSTLHVASASDTVLTLDPGATGRAAQVKLSRGVGNYSYLGLSSTNSFDFYTAEAVPIVFYNNAAEKMRITSAGNVGIGTTAPGAMLDVEGSTLINGSLTQNTAFTNETGPNEMFFSKTIITPTAASAASNYGIWNDLVFQGTNNSTGANTSLQGRSINFSTGTVSSVSAVVGMAQNRATGGSLTSATSVTATTTNSGGGTIASAYGVQASVSNTSGTITKGYGIYAAAPTGTFGDYYSIYSNGGKSYFAGNVGIGTTAPGYSLDVAGQVNATAFSIGGVPISSGGANAWAVNGTNISNTNTGNVGIGTTAPQAPLHIQGVSGSGSIRLSASSGSYGDIISANSLFSIDSYTGSAPMRFSTAGVERLRIDTAGNVGIGTTTPSNDFTVQRADADVSVTIRNTTASSTHYPNLRIENYRNGNNNNPNIYLSNYNGTYAAPSVMPSARTIGQMFFQAYDGTTSQQIASVQGLTGNSFAAGTLDGILAFNTRTGASALAERMRIDQLGNVGIGTTAPAYALDVSGAGRFTNSLSASNVFANNYTASATGSALGLNVGHGTTGLYFNSTNDLSFATNATDVMRLTFAGNVGIGTTAPAYKLDVAGGGNFQSLYVNGVAVGTGTSSPWATNGSVAYNTNSGNVGIGTTAPANALDVNGSLAIGTYAGTAVTATSSLAVPNKIGIGTVGPSFKLDINDANAVVYAPSSTSSNTPGYFTAEILNGTALDNSAAMLNFQAKNAALTAQQGWMGFVANTSGYAPTFVVGTRSGATAYSERLRIDQSGNVGIGTTAPGYTLDVAGQVNAAALSIGGVPISAGGASSWAANGTNVYNTNTGNIGIGTSTPGSKLTVVGPNSGGYPMTITAAPGTGPAGYMNLALNNTSSGAYKSAIEFQNSGTAKFSFGVDYMGAGTNNFSLFDNVAGTTRIWVDQGGKVGFGTTAPISLVSNTSSFNIDGAGNGVQAAGINWQVNAGTSYVSALTNTSNTTAANGLLVKVASSSAATHILDLNAGGTDQFVVNGNGYVGIGTTAPLYPLMVMGNAYVGNSLTIGWGNLATPGLALGGQSGIFQPSTQTFAIETSGAERLRISSTGNVGIGTTNPGYLLDVAGQVNATALSINGTLITAGGASAWATNGTNIYSTNAGNVGIGTTTPGSRLTIADTLANQPRIFITETTNGNNAQFGFDNSGIAQFGTSSNAPFRILAGSNERVRIDSSGNVGIGTTAPGYSLDVAGNANVSGTLSVGTLTSGTLGASTSSSAVYSPTSSSLTFPSGAKLSVSNTNGSANGTFAGYSMLAGNLSNTQRAFMGVVSNSTGFTPSIVFGQQVTNATSYAERLRIDPSGNVGIGTTAPGASLDVNGTLKTVHLVGGGNTPTAAVGSGAGTGATIPGMSGTDVAGMSGVTTGTSPTAGGNILVITFDTPYATAPYCVISAANAASASKIASVYATTSTTALTITNVSPALSASTTYGWTYHCVQ